MSIKSSDPICFSLAKLQSSDYNADFVNICPSVAVVNCFLLLFNKNNFHLLILYLVEVAIPSFFEYLVFHAHAYGETTLISSARWS